jgi:hypothetical protein
MPKHYILCQHGLLGNRTDFKRIEEFFDDEEDVEVVILTSNEAFTRTLDGVAAAGERCSTDILSFLASLPDDGTDANISVIGHSMGGLILRYALRLIESECPTIWEEKKLSRKAAIFLASPHVGIKSTPSFLVKFTTQHLLRHLSRTAADLTLSTDTLTIMCDEVGGNSLNAFHTVCLLANARGDRLICPTTALILPRVEILQTELNVKCVQIEPYMVVFDSPQGVETMHPEQIVLIDRLNKQLNNLARYLVYFPSTMPSVISQFDNSAHTKIIAHGRMDLFKVGLPIVQFIGDIVNRY